MTTREMHEAHAAAQTFPGWHHESILGTLRPMASTDYRSVDEYIAAKPTAVRPLLKTLRRTLRAAVPRAEERISYQIPSYKIHGAPLFFFAVWKEHFSLYPATGGITQAFKKELARYEVSKGTIRFPLDEPAPVALITRMAKFRAAENKARSEAKAKTKAKPKTTKRKKP